MSPVAQVIALLIALFVVVGIVISIWSASVLGELDELEMTTRELVGDFGTDGAEAVDPEAE